MKTLPDHLTPGEWPERPPGRFAGRIIDLHAERGAINRLAGEFLPGAGHRWRGIALIGLADDEGVRLNGGRVGARHGPDAFRAALAGYGGSAAIALQGLGTPVVDAGNIISGESLGKTHRRVTTAVGALIEAGLMPVGIGGGHDLTFAEVRAVIDKVSKPAGAELHGVYFDAHLDVREEQGSGMPFRRLIEYGGIGALHLFGMDPLANSAEHLQWFRDHGGTDAEWQPEFWPSHDYQFVSICLDAIDMAQAPGVSAPAPVGLPASLVADYVEAAGRQPSVCCFDIMELCPAHDEGGRTARLAAYLFLRFLVGLARRPRPGL